MVEGSRNKRMGREGWQEEVVFIRERRRVGRRKEKERKWVEKEGKTR